VIHIKIWSFIYEFASSHTLPSVLFAPAFLSSNLLFLYFLPVHSHGTQPLHSPQLFNDFHYSLVQLITTHFCFVVE